MRKYLKILVILFLINQLIILISNDSIRNGWWKSNSGNRLNGHDLLELKSNLKWNVISEKGEKVGIVQLYIGKKLLISNLTLTKWYLYENKNS